MRFGYEPYLNAQLSSLEGQAQKVGQSVSPADEANLVTFYSQISNLESLIKNHVFFSQFLTWLEQNTEANVYYTSMSFTSGNQVTLVGIAKTSADVSEQVAVFEASPEVSSVSLSNVSSFSSANEWIFNAVLTMQPVRFPVDPGESSPAVVVTSSLNRRYPPARERLPSAAAASTAASRVLIHHSTTTP